MKVFIKINLFSILLSFSSFSQVSNYEFGKGFKILSKDSTFSMRIGLRFQNLFINKWDIRNDDLSKIENHQSNFLIRRSRLKFDGFAYSPKLKYKLELGLSNRDISNPDPAYFSGSNNVVMDAYLEWNFSKGFFLKIGQGKLPGNRERVISSANLQFVDRSRLNSRFNLDRGIGLQLKHIGTISKQFQIKMIAALSQGEGRNVTVGNIGGMEYTYRLELLPFGKFSSKGDYFGSDLSREAKPKLAMGFTLDYNEKTGRNRGNLGNFINTSPNNLKTMVSAYADLMFKYKGFSFMGEYAICGTEDKNPQIFDENNIKVGTYYTGAALNLQSGYLFTKNYEFAMRYTKLVPQNSFVGNNEELYFIGFSRYFKGHSLKLQVDLGYEQIQNKNDGLVWRTQLDIHF